MIIINKFLFLFYLMFIFTYAINAEYTLDLITDEVYYWPSPALDKPEYLETVTDPTYNTKITRIVGNPGDSIPNITGEVWDSEQLRHGYSKRQPWNADGTILYLDRCPPDLWLDAKTYEPLYARYKPGSSVRWSYVEPNIMYHVGKSGDEQIGKWDVVADTTTELVDLRAYEDLSFGEGEGNFTVDNSKVAVYAIRRSDSKKVIFVVDIINKTKGADIDVSSIYELDNCTISSLGNYIVIVLHLDADNGDRLQIRNAATGDIIWEENDYGLPSHFDCAVDQNGDEVIVGVGKSDPYKGMVIKRRLSDGVMTALVDKGYAAHTSGRCTNRPGWVYVSYHERRESTSWRPYRNEIIAVKLDGSRVERICNLRAIKFDYLAESHPCPSPDGLKVIFASDWEKNDFPVQSYVVDLNEKVVANVELKTDENSEIEFSISPNPFNPTTTLSINLKNKSFASINIYNTSGKLVKTLASKKMSVGLHKFNWNSTKQPSGIYFAKIKIGAREYSKSLILLK